MSKIYLACPYSDPDPAVRQARYEVVTKAAGELIKRGHLVFSPITHGHSINQMCGTPTDYEYWREFNESMIDWCDTLVIVAIDGWDGSEGVGREYWYAMDNGKKIESVASFFQGEETKCDTTTKISD